MAKLDEQIRTMKGYFETDCEAEGKLSLGLEVEHFVTHSDGRAVTFAQLQAALRDLQQQGDAPVISESEYLGFRAPALSAVIGPACQLKITMTPQRDVQDLMDSYNRFYLQLCLTLAACGLRAWTVGYHPTQRAEVLPLIPQNRAEALDRYFKNTGACGGQMLRATAATRLSIDYFSEQDFVRKMRAASLLTPFFVLLSDNAPVYQTSRNSAYGISDRKSVV